MNQSVHGDDSAAGWAAGPIATPAGPVGAIIRGRYKLTNQPPAHQAVTQTPAWRLYDLDADPGEIDDIAADNPGLVADLIREWEADWR